MRYGIGQIREVCEKLHDFFHRVTDRKKPDHSFGYYDCYAAYFTKRLDDIEKQQTIIIKLLEKKLGVSDQEYRDEIKELEGHEGHLICEKCGKCIFCKECECSED